MIIERVLHWVAGGLKAWARQHAHLPPPITVEIPADLFADHSRTHEMAERLQVAQREIAITLDILEKRREFYRLGHSRGGDSS